MGLRDRFGMPQYRMPAFAAPADGLVKVIHDYFGVNLEIVWAVVEKELQKLAEAIRALET